MLDFDPRDRDDDVRDIEMPWIELRRESGLDREDIDPRDLDDARDRDRDPRERDVDPRDAFVEGLELPRGLEREVVFDGEHRYELNGRRQPHACGRRRISGDVRARFPRSARRIVA